MDWLDQNLPRLTELELAQIFSHFRDSGTDWRAVEKVSKHITRQSIELERAERAIAWLMRTHMKDLALVDPLYTDAINQALRNTPEDKPR